jgi:hypothetical protein
MAPAWTTRGELTWRAEGVELTSETDAPPAGAGPLSHTVTETGYPAGTEEGLKVTAVTVTGRTVKLAR